MSVSLTRRSQGPSGQDFNGQSDFPDVSADGLYVVFSTEASNAFLNDNNSAVDVWRQNSGSGALERVSSTTAGQPTDGASFSPVISADGRYVAFTSLATNLTLNDSNGFPDVFRKDMDTGAVLIVSSAPDGLPANSVSFGPTISADGRYVAFLSAASNIVNDDTNLSVDVFRKDMVTSKTVRVDLAADGTEATAGAISRPSISGDGRYVAFDSAAANLTANDTNNRDDVFVKDMQTGSIIRASETANGLGMTGSLEGSLRPSISADGHFVVFATTASNLVTGDTNGVADIFRKDLVTGSIIRVSVDALGHQGDADSRDATISADGRYVSFTSQASNLTNGDNQLSDDIFVKDLSTGALTLISRNAAGTPAFGQSVNADISADGATIVFASTASTLVPTDTNFLQDIFAASLGAPSGTQTGTEGPDILTGGNAADHLIGLGGDDTLIGNDGSDTLEGGAGNDLMLGGPGNDAMIGGDGNDIYQVDSPGDAVVEQETGGTDTVFVLISGWSLSGNIEIARLLDDGASLTGSNDDEQLVANAAHGTLLDGGGGDDVLWGQGLDDTLIGGLGDDVLRGGGGNDSMLGGDGNDQAVIEQLGDLFIELPDGGLDTAWVTVSGWALPGNVEIGRLASNANTLFGSGTGQALVANPLFGSLLQGGDGADELWGSDLGDTLAGGGGDDTLRGGLGEDLMRGGVGNDTYVVKNLGDRVEEAVGGGYDTAYVTADAWVVGANVEVTYLAGTATRLNGSEGNDNLIGNPLYGSTLDGRGGDDTLYGSPFADLLAGGLGNDVLWALGGADIFAFHIANWGQDWVMDFSHSEGDKLDFRGSGVSGFGQLSLIANGPNTILLFGSQAVTVRGITDIGASDCLF
jgi:Ca2+-binding RTX toxin-like protein